MFIKHHMRSVLDPFQFLLHYSIETVDLINTHKCGWILLLKIFT